MNINQTSTETRQENSATARKPDSTSQAVTPFPFVFVFLVVKSSQIKERKTLKSRQNSRRRDAFVAPSSGWETKPKLKIWDDRGFGFPRRRRGNFSQSGEVLAMSTLEVRRDEGTE